MRNIPPALLLAPRGGGALDAKPRLELLEDRCLLSATPAQHVLLLSVDGLHQADIADPNLQPDLTNIISLQNQGVTYANASTTKPSDSFPGALSYLTESGARLGLQSVAAGLGRRSSGCPG